ncbi:hypothetical protein [Mucilaginibacter sp. BT774]|uniref:hypothetical protein n=1 Tax=Mucilaginibacter sp. BT774 TaxID=3062276 RepID=UPI0026769C0F|nr:hypothetical protein [Mucilaginibacter sp. BT774]MDO3627489.1 hypothetical protein [Mucilaginibacter sp. BT774]
MKSARDPTLIFITLLRRKQMTSRDQNILLVTTTQLSLNPRLVKEADALTDAGYTVTVIYAYWNKWGYEYDQLLLPQKKWRAICVGGDPLLSPRLYYISRVIHNLALIFHRKSGGKLFTDIAIARASYFLNKATRRLNADLYVAHNPGALPAVIKASKKNRKPCGFDAEDFHRNEMSNNKSVQDVILKTNIENRYFPQLDYLSTSSPLIASAYQKIFPDIKPTVLLNVFPADARVPEAVPNLDQPIRLFWFSQTIGINRGLEDIIAALELLKEYPFQLHLLGHLSEATKTNYVDGLVGGKEDQIHLHQPIPSDNLAVFSSQFDIGLALEPAFSNNNNMALSNKIFTYLQGGLAVVASDTDAQLQFLNDYPAVGKAYKKGDAALLADVLLSYHLNRYELLEAKKKALQLARQELNWENESKTYLQLVKQTLKSK